MSDINNIPIVGNVGKTDKISTQPTIKGDLTKCCPDDDCCKKTPQTEIPASAGVAGRSMVKSTDNIDADIKFAMEHPELVANSDDCFEMAFKGKTQANDPDAYAKACVITKAFADELVK